MAEETLALAAARAQIAGLVCAAGVLGEKLPDKTYISSGLFAVKTKQNATSLCSMHLTRLTQLLDRS